MGSSHSSEVSSSEIKEFGKYYTLVKSSYDYRFGKVSIYQHNESKQLVLVNHRSFQTINDRTAFVNDLKIRQLSQHPSVAKIIGYSLEEGTTLCGQTASVSIYSEFYQDDLLRELRARQKSQEKYTEQEVWYLVETLVSALAFQQEGNNNHGDIHPQNVILTSNGQAKLLNNGIVSLYKNNFVRRLQGQSNLYLSPEALEQVATKFVSPSYNAAKADVYSLGVSLLFVTLLQDPISLYNFQKNTVNHEQVDALLNQVLKTYSFQLTDLIRQMLMQDPLRRPSALELRGLVGIRPNQVQQRVVQPFGQQSLVQQPLIQSQFVQQPQQFVQQPQFQQQPLRSSLVGQQVFGGQSMVGQQALVGQQAMVGQMPIRR